MAEKLAIIGTSPALKKVLRDAKRLAVTDLSVLITGETGTGKELLARQIHLWWVGRGVDADAGAAPTNGSQPFVAFNCAALPENLIESELFGYEPGAFSGAAKRHFGLLKQADGGTLFLDEVADLSLATQAKLLRALQEGEIRPLGSERVVRVRVRFIAATNKDLAAEVKAGRFREDLFYRLHASVALCLPPLRERRTDIPALVKFALAGLATRTRTPRKRIRRDGLALLMIHDWPGNVRQLLHAVETAAALCTGTAITRAALARALGLADANDGGVNDIAAAALEEMARQAALSAARLRDLTGCSRKECHAVLRDLQRRDRIARRGQGRATYYVKADESKPPKTNTPAPADLPAADPAPPKPSALPAAGDLNARQAELVATLPVGGRVTTGEYRRRFGVGRATAFRDLDALAEAKVLSVIGHGRGAAYVRRQQDEAIGAIPEKP